MSLNKFSDFGTFSLDRFNHQQLNLWSVLSRLLGEAMELNGFEAAEPQSFALENNE